MASAVRYAGFWVRLGAHVIDSMIFFLLLIPFIRLFTSGGYLKNYDAAQGLWAQFAVIEFDWLYFLLDVVLPLVMVVWLWWKYRGTPGKLMLDIEVVDECSHKNLSLRQSVLRYFSYIVSILPLGLGIFWIIWDPKKQGFHDKIAKTVVLRRDPDNCEDCESRKSLSQLMDEAQ